MGALRQRTGRVRPAPVRVRSHRTDRLTIDLDRHRRVRLSARTRDRRRRPPRDDIAVAVGRLPIDRIDRQSRRPGRRSSATGAATAVIPTAAAGRGCRNAAGRGDAAEYSEQRTSRQPVADRRISERHIDDAIAGRLQCGAELHKKSPVVLNEDEIVIIRAVLEERLNAHCSAVLEFDDQVVPRTRIVGHVLLVGRQQKIRRATRRRDDLRTVGDRNIDVIAQDRRGNHCPTPCRWM
ncbi:uncharacterized protein BCN122_II2491 [Burkholderia cenocepacia]|nr:uncharacterized protein BCN122_II2491 [Burkholderia cenocepacia]